MAYVLPGYFTRDGISGHLGLIHPSEESPYDWQHAVNHTSADGTLAGGAYRSPSMIGSLLNDGSAWGALIWTRDTGHVLAPELLQELGQALDWPPMWVTAISPSGEYLVVTTGEIFQPGMGTPSTARSALLRLINK